MSYTNRSSSPAASAVCKQTHLHLEVGVGCKSEQLPEMSLLLTIAGCVDFAWTSERVVRFLNVCKALEVTVLLFLRCIVWKRGNRVIKCHY